MVLLLKKHNGLSFKRLTSTKKKKNKNRGKATQRKTAFTACTVCAMTPYNFTFIVGILQSKGVFYSEMCHHIYGFVLITVRIAVCVHTDGGPISHTRCLGVVHSSCVIMPQKSHRFWCWRMKSFCLFSPEFLQLSPRPWHGHSNSKKLFWFLSETVGHILAAFILIRETNGGRHVQGIMGKSCWSC